MKENLTVFVDFLARLNAMSRQLGMHNKIRQPTAHKAVEMFFILIVVLLSGNTVRSRCTFLAMIINLKLTKINDGRNKAKKIIKDTAPEIKFIPVLEMTLMTAVEMINIPRRVSSLRLFTDV